MSNHSTISGSEAQAGPSQSPHVNTEIKRKEFVGPNLTVSELKVEAEEENNAQSDHSNDLKVGASSEDEKYMEKLHSSMKQYEERILENEPNKNFDDVVEETVIKRETNIVNVAAEDSSYGQKSPFTFKSIEHEEVHIKHDYEELEPTKKLPKRTRSLHLCPECPYKNHYKHNLMIHLNKHKKPNEIAWYTCLECPYKSLYKNYLQSHSKKHKKPDETIWHVCQECPYKTLEKRYLTQHTKIHSTNQIFKCSKCSYQTLKVCKLKKHQVEHRTSTQWLSCSECSFKTLERRVFKSHLFEHKSDGFESFDTWQTCSLCPYKTYYKRLLIEHCKQHSGTYTQNSDSKELELLKCKVLTNTHLPWLQCPSCVYQTIYKKRLKKHQLRYHGENKPADKYRWFECSNCNFKSTHKYLLERHKLVHKEAHEVEWLHCYNCPFETKYKQCLVRHMHKHKTVSVGP